MEAQSAPQTDGYTVVGLHISGLQKISVVDLTPPKDGVVRIIGKNEAGKSSLLNSIALALAGLPKGAPSPLQHGRDRGEVVVNLGPFQVQRVFTESNQYLTVKRADGKVAKPQAFLDELVGQGLGFDPFAFSTMKPAQQVTLLLDALKLEQDPRDIDKERQGYYEQRTEKNREVKSLEARIAAIPDRPEVPSEEISVADLMQERAEALKAKLEFQNVKERLSRADSDVLKAQAEVDRIKRVLVDAETSLRHCQAEKDALTNALASITVPDTTDLDERLTSVEETNRAVRAKQERTRLVTELATVAAKAQELTEAMDLCDVMKESVLAGAELPVEGLGFETVGGEYMVCINGIPLSQCSQSQKLKVGMGLSMALNPKVRVILIREASLLDDESMALVDAMARTHGYQCWLERVGQESEGENSFVLEAGELRS